MKKLVFSAIGVFGFVAVSLAFASRGSTIYCFNDDGSIPSPSGQVCTVPINDLAVSTQTTSLQKYCNATSGLACTTLRYIVDKQ
ncbi:hypothetical protein [Chitinophaga sp. MM2321]|uniref:hypothetical protein n=1 Tax=Chitinophaga sp. MM2321 TaxID=3137178 RepID=UPI0032D56A5E